MTKPRKEISALKVHENFMPRAYRFGHEAMATTFEILVIYQDEQYARQAVQAAFDELDKLEQELSCFVENSDISRINNLKNGEGLTLGPAAFECLQLSRRIYAETAKAFDVTLGRGMQNLKLDDSNYTIKLQGGPVQVDLGGIGKGYAVDCMAKLLREWEVDCALIHGGHSSILALDTPFDTSGWPCTISSPDKKQKLLADFPLKNNAVSGSGLQKGAHIIDPRTHQPVKDTLAAWAWASDAATADALSTAFMVMTPEKVQQYCLQHRKVRAMLIPKTKTIDESDVKILRFGF